MPVTHECVCGRDYTLGRDGDPFTHFSISRHHQDAPDFAVSVCPDCAADVLPTLVAWARETDTSTLEADDGD